MAKWIIYGMGIFAAMMADYFTTIDVVPEPAYFLMGAVTGVLYMYLDMRERKR